MNTLKLSTVFMIAFAFMQIIYWQGSIESTLMHHLMLPVVYAVFAVITFAYTGLKSRSVSYATRGNVFAVNISIFFLYLTLILILFFVFGVKENSGMFTSISTLNRIWSIGVVFFLRELIRYKIMRNTSKKMSMPVIAILTLTFTIAEIHIYYPTLISVQSSLLVMIGNILPVLIINAVFSVIAQKSDFFSMLLIGIAYYLFPAFAPILPAISRVAFSYVSAVMGILSLSAFIFVNRDKKTSRHIKFSNVKNKISERKNFLSVSNISSILFTGIVFAFLLGLFPYYPMVVMTNSMAGTFDRGSFVIIERLSEMDIFYCLEVGHVIHYSRGYVDYFHRVVDFFYDNNGIRMFVTQGDNSDFPYTIITENDVHGRVIAALPILGYPVIIVRYFLMNL